MSSSALLLRYDSSISESDELTQWSLCINHYSETAAAEVTILLVSQSILLSRISDLWYTYLLLEMGLLAPPDISMYTVCTLVLLHKHNKLTSERRSRYPRVLAPHAMHNLRIIIWLAAQQLHPEQTTFESFHH
jgi:hypothetical protein